MKKLMILGASILQLPAILKAKEMGLQVIAVDMNPNALGFKEDGVIPEIVSTIDIDGVVEVAKRHDIDGIVTICTDMPVRTVAKVAEVMNLPGISVESAYKATNKAAMRKALEEHNVPIPKYFKVSTKEEYLAAISNFKKKCIVKPADNSGSCGIKLIPDVTDLQNVESTFEYSKTFSRSGEIVVEEYMEGPEVCVETLNINGVCYPIQITDKITTGAPYFVEMGHTQPSRLCIEYQEDIKRVAIAANMAIGNYNGASCTEIIVTDEGAKVVELGARLAGDCMTTHLVPYSCGVDMVESVINIALGNNHLVNPTHKFERAAAIRYMKSEEGVISAISGLEDAMGIDNVKHVTTVYGIGDQANEIKKSGDRIGFVISQADTADEAEIACNKAMEHIVIEVN